jgi:hypothetical protein
MTSCYGLEKKDGMFSVRSAYHYVGSDKRANQPETSTSNHSKMWSKIWSLPLPNKVKNFIWRLAKQIIPTRGNLQRRRVVLDPICPLCFMDHESDDHLFMQCPLALQVWFASPLGAHPPPNSNILSWLLHWLSCKESLATCWAIFLHMFI